VPGGVSKSTEMAEELVVDVEDRHTAAPRPRPVTGRQGRARSLRKIDRPSATRIVSALSGGYRHIVRKLHACWLACGSITAEDDGRRPGSCNAPVIRVRHQTSAKKHAKRKTAHRRWGFRRTIAGMSLVPRPVGWHLRRPTSTTVLDPGPGSRPRSRPGRWIRPGGGAIPGCRHDQRQAA
jgi:hypothetical protein